MIRWWKTRKINKAIKQQHNKRPQVLCNLSNAKSAIVMIHYTQVAQVTRFIEKLQQQGLSTQLWVFNTPKKCYEQLQELPNSRIVKRDELTRFLAMATPPLRQEWQALKPDILIDLTNRRISLVGQLAALSLSPLKVGSRATNNTCYDLVIVEKESKDATILGDNILFYLSKIDMKNNNL